MLGFVSNTHNLYTKFILGIIMKIQLQRNIGYHLVQTYIPSVVFVTLSWLALFISADSIPGRCLFFGIETSLPRVYFRLSQGRNRFKLIICLIIHRPSGNGNDNVTYVDGNVRSNSSKCSKSLLHFLSRYMDAHLYSFCI